MEDLQLLPIIFMSIESDFDKNKVIEIYEQYRSLMMYIAMQVLHDHALAEDAVSESFEKIIKNIHKVGDIACYKTRSLIVIIVKNTAINIWNKRKRTDTSDLDNHNPADNSPSVSEEIITAESYNKLVKIIDNLPDTYRDVAVLSLLHELSHQEIADTLNISYDTVKMRMSRAKKEIRKKLETGKKVMG